MMHLFDQEEAAFDIATGKIKGRLNVT